ncbi:MAG: DUF4349 domain-containing protein [Bacteroidota bacterium]
MKRFIPLLLGIIFFSCQGNLHPGNAESSSNLNFMTNEGDKSYKDFSETLDEDFTTDDQSRNKKSQPLSQNQPEETKKEPEVEKKDGRKMIKTAEIRMEVSDFEEGRTEIDKAIAKYDATITSENEQRTSYQLRNGLVIRVKPEEFDALVNDLEGIALNLDSKNIDAKDVTEQFVDITSRLRTKREVEERYRDILKQAKTISDILAVEGQLRTIVEEIESLEGRLKYLNDQVGYSTINLNYYEAVEQTYTRKKGFWKRIGNSFGDGWEGMKEFLIGLTSIWPFVLIIGGVIWWVTRTIRRGRKKKNQG